MDTASEAPIREVDDMTATDRRKSSPPRRRRLCASLSSSCRHLGLAAACLLALSGCGQSEPQLPCGEVYQKVYQVAHQLDRDDMEVVDLTTQFERRAELCAHARAFVQKQKELQKLVRDNKDRCKEYDFSPANIGAFSMASPGVSGTMVESEGCK
jgi:hypothetical protein